VVGGNLAGKMVDPGGELALVAVGVPVFQDAVENELHEILAGGALAGESHEETIERPVIALEQVAQPLDLAGAHGEHEFVIGGIRGVHSDGFLRGLNHGWTRMNTDFCQHGDHGMGGRSWKRDEQGNRPARERLQVYFQLRPDGEMRGNSGWAFASERR
jgi:hypothetical protein